MVFKDYGNIFHSGNPFCSFLKPECLQNFVRMLSRCKNNICLFLSAKLWISNLGSSEVKRKYYWLIIMPLGKAWKRKPKIEIVLWQLLSLFLLFFSLSHTLFSHTLSHFLLTETFHSLSITLSHTHFIYHSIYLSAHWSFFSFFINLFALNVLCVTNLIRLCFSLTITYKPVYESFHVC
jgi:hypothetical protein